MKWNSNDNLEYNTWIEVHKHNNWITELKHNKYNNWMEAQ